MDEVRNDTRICNPMQTFCCGGYGEEVRLESTFCGGLCYRVRGGGGGGYNGGGRVAFGQLKFPLSSFLRR